MSVTLAGSMGGVKKINEIGEDTKEVIMFIIVFLLLITVSLGQNLSIEKIWTPPQNLPSTKTTPTHSTHQQRSNLTYQKEQM